MALDAMCVSVYRDTMAVNVSITLSGPLQSVQTLLVRMRVCVVLEGMVLLAYVLKGSLVNFVKRPPQLRGDASAIPAITDPLVRTPRRGPSAHAQWDSLAQNVAGPLTTVN